MAMMLYAIEGYGQIPHATINVAAHVMLTSTWDQFEPSIAIDKLHAPNLLASFTTTYYSNTSQYNYQGWQYFSPIGSITPLNATTTMPHSAQSHGAPGATFDAGGRATLWGTNGDETGFFDVTTDDDCNTWNTPTTNTPVTYGPSSPFSGDYRFPSYAVDDAPNSPNINNYYAAWTDLANSATVIKTQRSTDRGGSFGDEKQLNAGSTAYGANIQTGENGQVYVAWANLGPVTSTTTSGGLPMTVTNSPAFPAQNIAFAVSTDGGASFPTANINETAIQNIVTIGANGDETADWTYGGTEVNGNPSMAVDKSCGPNSGTIYIVAALQGVNSSDIGLWSSINQGQDWTFGGLINQSASPVQSHCWSPWIAVDDVTGIVSVVYFGYDGSDQSNTNTWVAFFNPSDPIPSWSNIKVSSGPQSPYPFSYDASTAGTLSDLFDQSFEGMYIGIDAYNGHAFPVWKDRRSGLRQIWIADIQYNAPQIFSTNASQNICNFSTSETLIGTQTFEASDHINIATCGEAVSIGSTSSTANVHTVAGQNILIGHGFSTAPGSVFTAEIRSTDGCQTPGVQSSKTNTLGTGATSNSMLSGNNPTMSMIKAYPNPTSDMVNIIAINNNYQNVSFTVTDISGRVMEEYSNGSLLGNNITKTIDVSFYSKGIYFITMQADNQKYTAKFVKE